MMCSEPTCAFRLRSVLQTLGSLAGCLLLFAACGHSAFADRPTGNWPQAAGPHGNWRADGSDAPARWSVSHNENVVWRTPLPEGGQSTVVVWGDRLFATTHEPWPTDAPEKLKPQGRNVDGYCLDSRTGKILWKVKLPGIRDMKYAGIYSDSTSPSPVTDGRHVWFFNASGSMGCWDFEGKPVWTRRYQPRKRHHSRQHEPILFGDVILNVEVLDKEAAKRTGMHEPLPKDVDPRKLWTFLHAIDKRTGKIRWVAEDGTAIHNTPTLGRLPDGRPAVLHGRGGGHAPPETPYGPSLTSLADGEQGKTLWRFPIDKGSSHYTSAWNGKHACWFNGEEHLVIDATNGKLLRRQSLEKKVRLTEFDQRAGKYVTRDGTNVSIRKGRGNSTPSTNQANILVGQHHYFLTHERHLIGRVHIGTGAVEYLQVPVQVIRESRKPDETRWTNALPNDTCNTRGVDIGTVDKRSKGNGWGHVSAASPIAVGHRIYFTTMPGMTYVIDSTAPHLDERALISINDSGPAGKTWSLSSLSYANGRVYHRTMKEVICLGEALDSE